MRSSRLTHALSGRGRLRSRVERLLSTLEVVLEEDAVEDYGLFSWLRGALVPASRLVARGAAPPALFMLVAAAMMLVRPKDYAAQACWDEAMRLKDSVVERRRAEDALALVVAADRVALLGVGRCFHDALGEARARLHAHMANGDRWETLLFAIDAVGAASHSAIERVSRNAARDPRSPALAWLEEITRRVSRDARADESARRLDALLDSGVFGRRARHLAVAVRLARDWFAEAGNAPFDAWPTTPTRGARPSPSISTPRAL